MNKIKGWVIGNGSLKSTAFIELFSLYQVAAKELNIDLKIIFNNELIVGIEDDRLSWHHETEKVLPDFVLFMDKDIHLAKHLEACGVRVFNSSWAIECCDDKAKTCKALVGKGIKMPHTIIAPLMYKAVHEDDFFIQGVEEKLGYPMVIKECFGSFGEQVYLVSNREELIDKRKELMNVPHLYQEFIPSSRGRDVRMLVVGGIVVAAMLRTNSNDFRANIASGGQANYFNPPDAFKKMAVEASKLIGTDFAGVDLLFGQNEEPILCEVNSNAHIKAIQACTGVNVAEKILEYIVSKIKS